MKKSTKIFLIISIILSVTATFKLMTGIFSTKFNKYYKVDA